jgi:hypothetical protein
MSAAATPTPKVATTHQDIPTLADSGILAHVYPLTSMLMLQMPET